jgi:Na+-transporting NADH:ubiquinone oxidoreductase subunit D
MVLEMHLDMHGFWYWSLFFRELLGSGKLLGVQAIPDFVYEMGYVDNGLMLLSPMALITVGLIIWVQRSRNRKLIEQG